MSMVFPFGDCDYDGGGSRYFVGTPSSNRVTYGQQRGGSIVLSFVWSV